MDQSNTKYFTSRQEWREWLSINFDKEKEIWLIYYKKHTGKPRIPYDDAVEEAICFGWIDSTVKRIDEERFKQKFTPRNASSNWSDHNISRALKMISDGKMTNCGLALFDEWKNKKKTPVKKEAENPDLIVPVDLINALKDNELAFDNFNALAYSYTRNYLGWINSAKREETRQKRIKEAVSLLEKNVKSLMK